MTRFRLSFSLAAAALMLLAAVLNPPPAAALLAGHLCDSCHSTHSAPGYSLLNQPSQADLVLTAELVCLNCHGPDGSASAKAAVHTNDPSDPTPDYPAFRISCIDCHDSHDNQPNYLGGTNIKTILPQVETPASGTYNIAFESRGTNAGEPALHSFADGDATYDGICEACHTATNHHWNNPGGDHSHHAGETCTRCHAHTDAFNQ